MEPLSVLPPSFVLAVSRNGSYAKYESYFSGTEKAIFSTATLRGHYSSGCITGIRGNDIIQINSREMASGRSLRLHRTIYIFLSPKVTKLPNTVPEGGNLSKVKWEEMA